jgi:hypothetical protein
MARQARRSRCDGPEGAVFGGRALDAAEVARVREVVRAHRADLRSEVVRAVCREMDWRRPNGALRLRACRDLLVRLSKAGEIALPAGRGAERGVRARRGALPCAASEADREPVDIALRRIAVRPIEPGELSRWRAEMERHHYLGDGVIVGETVRHVAEEGGRWVALVAWGAAALKSRHRDAWIGWDEATKYRRLSLVTNNVRFLVLPGARVPHLASAVLARSVRRLSRDFEARYGHPVLLAETFVDVERFRGTCYLAANWIRLGETRGMARKGRGYEAHGRKKALLVYALEPRAREVLAAPMLSPEILRRSSMASMPALYVDVNKLPLDGAGGLMEALRMVVDPRSRRGRRYPFETVLALAAMACLSGAKSYEAIAEWAKDLPKELLRRMRCWCWRAPCESTFRRILQGVDADDVDRRVGAWLADLAKRGAIALDGKVLRGSGDAGKPAVHLLSAITHTDGVVVAQQQVAEKSNEIPGAKLLLADLDLEGVTVTADAMHTQTNLARFLVEEKKADYVFVAKDNQPTLRADIEAVAWESLPPSGPDDRQGTRPDRAAHDPSLR